MDMKPQAKTKIFFPGSVLPNIFWMSREQTSLFLPPFHSAHCEAFIILRGAVKSYQVKGNKMSHNMQIAVLDDFAARNSAAGNFAQRILRQR